MISSQVMTNKITAIFGIAVMTAILLGGLAFSQSAFANGNNGQQKVTICHLGDEGPETITVAAPAVPAHLAHGDTLGSCEPPILGDLILTCLCGLPENEEGTDLPEPFCVADARDPETVQELFTFCRDFCGLGSDSPIGFGWNQDDPACNVD